MTDYDLIVVGGGIGGSALATVMARAGYRVLVLEASDVFVDRVRGEWIAPWGVAETRALGIYDTLIAAGGHHLARHVTYDETRSPTESEAAAMPLDIFLPDVPGPLCIGHPHHCQTLFDAAAAAGAKMLREVEVQSVRPGANPGVTYRHQGESFEATARLIIGADGRTSTVRDAAGIELHRDPPHHWFAGLLVQNAPDWPEDLQAIGTEGDFAFLAFPQGDGRVRVYGGYALDQQRRFAGPDGPRKFLDAFNFASSPLNRALVAGDPAGPLHSFHNADSWTEKPFAEGVVLVGDAAGWNDPILGLGLSITYRDVRIVTDLLKGADDWSEALFAPYAEERTERLRRLRFIGRMQATLDMEFDAAASARRADLHHRSLADPSLRMAAFGVMAGPDKVPEEAFTEEARVRVLGV